VDALHRAVARFLRDHGISRAEPLLAAVSGGADSTTLLHVLVQLGQRVAVAHVHHELRGADADADAEFVATLGARLGVPVRMLRASQLDAPAPKKTSPEARARALRYAALEQLRAAGGHTHVLTAHTLDDQAETLLLRALRGSDLGGLAGIAPRLDARRLLRPLLGVRRSELRTYLSRRGLAWREDGSNADLSIPRNLLRAQVLPVLEQVHPGALRHLAALADTARAWREPVASDAAARLARLSWPGDGGLWVDLERLAVGSPAQRRSSIAELLRRGGIGARLTRGHLERIESFLHAARTGGALSLPERRVLVRGPELFWLGSAPGPSASFERDLVPGEVLELPGCGLALRLERGPERGSGVALPLCAPVIERLTVRSPRSLDVLRESERSARRLSEWLADARWPRALRRRLAVVEKQGCIVGLVAASSQGTRTWSPAAASGAATASEWRVRAERLSPVSTS
jgi:tRNA(Ile)-lysidine synthase